MVEVREGDAMPLLQVPDSSCGRHIKKSLARLVAEEPVRHQAFVCWVSRAEIVVQESVVVDVAEV